MSDTEEKKEEEEKEFDFDLKDDSWLKDEEVENEEKQEEETEKEEEKLKIDISKINRELIPKTVLVDYIRERVKQTHNKRLLVSGEGEKTLWKVAENNLKEYLDKLINTIVDLVAVSDLKTIFQRHILCGDKILSGSYTDFAVCETNETDK